MYPSRATKGSSPMNSSENGNHSDQEDVSLINPFATDSVRHRPRTNKPLPPAERVGSLRAVSNFQPYVAANTVLPAGRQKKEQPHHEMKNNNVDNDFLEMEASSPLRNKTFRTIPQDDDEDLLDLGHEPLRTSSGLLLTHRKTPYSSSTKPSSRPMQSIASHERSQASRNMEFDSGFFNNDPYEGLRKAKRLLFMMRFWVAAFAVFLVMGSMLIVHSSRHERLEPVSQTRQEMQAGALGSNAEESFEEEESFYGDAAAERIILVPVQNVSQLTAAAPRSMLARPKEDHGVRRALRRLRGEFEEWVSHHRKNYHSGDEKEKRFRIWVDNHHRTLEKNEHHGPCKMTGQPVFGSNMFKDLSPDEFKSMYLTGYNGPKTDELRKKKKATRTPSEGSGLVLDADQRGGPVHSVKRHPMVQEKYLEHWKSNQHATSVKGNRRLKESRRNLRNAFGASYSGSCEWYDISCWLRLIVNTYGFNIGGTMEPNYDSDTYPSAIDWRDVGAVTDVHSQGNCGACWAITAVETVESAYYMSSGTLLELAESEVISCDYTCEMCEGGWPQNAYEYVMENNGLPLESSLSYDGDFLLALTMATQGESYDLSEEEVEYYLQSTCPNGGGQSGSADRNYNNNVARYGKIKGYGYATDRCVCYTDGTGCDCDDQNEKLAVMNIATYGPATVCLEASLWQDYAGGIITSELGCSAAFLDMNHCVQAVGYAFIDTSEGDEDGDENGSDSHSHSNDSDDGSREGYWIIRNQWSSNWGMSGYAYVAMGENTCGVLNDMTQVFS